MRSINRRMLAAPVRDPIRSTVVKDTRLIVDV